MPRLLVILFWCWFAVSVFILLRRGARRVGGSSAPARSEVTAPVRREWPPLHEIDPVPADDAVDGATDEPPAAARGVFGHPTATIATALEGIRMPCDLAPLTGSLADIERRVAFFTVGWPAEAVGPEVADELERIGMQFTSLSDNRAVARRDDVEVRVALHSVGSAINGIADPTFPTAPEHSVVVEFELS
jgi:hypothetical protein